MKTYIMLALCAVTIGSSHHAFAMQEDNPSNNAPTLEELQAINPIQDNAYAPAKPTEDSEEEKRLKQYKEAYQILEQLKMAAGICD